MQSFHSKKSTIVIPVPMGLFQPRFKRAEASRVLILAGSASKCLAFAPALDRPNALIYHETNDDS